MSSEKIDKEILETLTPEERAAIEDTEFSPEELEAMKGVAGDDDDDDDSADSESAPEVKPGAEQEEKAPAASDAEPVAGNEAVKADSGTASTEEKPRQAASYKAELPADYNDQVSALREQTRALAEKFKAGDIEFEEYQTELDAINEKREELTEFRVKANISTEMAAQSVEQQWQSAVTGFVAAVARNEGIDYQTDAEKQADLDAFVKTLAANPKNEDKSFDWFLDEAHRRVKALHGITETKAVDTPAPPKADEKPAAPSRKPPLEAAPKSLAQVPGGDGAGDIGGEFADIDSLEGMELEMALKKMTPSQLERYQRGE